MTLKPFYYTVVLGPGSTPWHAPKGETGPFARVTRGAFDSETEALAWCERCGIRDGFTVRKVVNQ